MAYDPQVIAAARAQLEQRRGQATNRAAAMRARLCEQIPRLKEIEQQLAAAIPAVAHAILTGNSEREIARIREENLRLQKEMAELLHKAGYERDNFEPQYTCPHCEDTGYANGRMCACFSQLLKDEACRQLSGLSCMKLTDFDDMQLGYYDDTVDARLGISPREQMQGIITYCREYAAAFTPNAQSLLLQGPTGTGKTHLSLAIAKAVTEQGFGVVYSSVQPLLRKLESEHFGRSEGDSEEQLIACDLLVLDDLGMEFDSPFYRACLYNVINGRLLENKPTIISTNLGFSAIATRYGDQIASRINGGFEPLLCVGKDIRQLRRRRAME
ncbi:MAG: ATP-binding protein [Clostridia bacterium]|nr:ATP-binding protein [Clostridia bacterium]